MYFNKYTHVNEYTCFIEVCAYTHVNYPSVLGLKYSIQIEYWNYVQSNFNQTFAQDALLCCKTDIYFFIAIILDCTHFVCFYIIGKPNGATTVFAIIITLAEDGGNSPKRFKD